MDIRDCSVDDLPELLAIYNDVIATSTAVYSESPSSLEERIAWWAGRVKQRYPVLVGTDDSGVIGFVSLSTQTMQRQFGCMNGWGSCASLISNRSDSSSDAGWIWFSCSAISNVKV